MILVFEESSTPGTYLYKYPVTATSLGNNTFEASLQATDSKVKTCLIGNVTDISAITAGDSYEEMISLLTVPFPAAGPECMEKPPLTSWLPAEMKAGRFICCVH